MTAIETAPTAVHIGADDLPFVDIGDGSKLKVIQVKEREGLWIVENIFQDGYEVQKHRHTGPVWGYTRSGAWKYKEYDYVNRAGSFLYEPAGSVHTLPCIEDDTRVWFHMYGVNLNLDADDNVERVADGAGTLAFYLAMCEQMGCPARTCSSTETGPMIDLYDPDAYVAAPPHAFLAELRRTQPVYFQEMRDEPGYWMVLKHADLVHVAREPMLFSASEGGVMLENLEKPAPRMRNMLLAMDPPRHVDYRRPVVPRFKARVIAAMEEQIREICREIMAGAARAGRRRVRARRHLAPAVAGHRPAHGPAPEDLPMIHRLAEMNTSSQDAEFVEPPTATPATHRHGDVRDPVRGATPRGAAARRPHDAAARDRLQRQLHDRHRLRQLLRAARHRRQRHDEDDAVVGLLALLEHPDQLAALRADHA